MSGAKFTPGPWLANIDGPFTLGGDGTTIDAVTEDGKEVRREICNLLLDTGDGDDENPDFEEDLANARLISASPDLLAAAAEIISRWEAFAKDEGSVNPLDYFDGDDFAQLRDAVARATGEGSSPP